MPSVLVLVLGSDVSLASVADAVVAGAKNVRFTEVAVRAAQPDVFRYKPLDADAPLGSDGIVVVAPADGSVEELRRVVGTQVLTNTVLARTGDAGADLSAALVGLGGIVVSADGPAATGERVAKVAGWVRHSLGHEAEHHHHHHEHDHHQGHGHDHDRSHHDHQH